MSSRCYLLPLLAVLTSATTALAAGDAQQSGSIPKGNSLTRHSPFGFVHALIGAQPLEVIGDNRTRFRKTKYGKASRPKRIKSEGYSLDIVGRNISTPYVDNFAITVEVGRQYTLALMGDLESTTPPLALIVDLPNVVIPKTDTHLVFANASPDAPPVDVFIDNLLVREAIASGESTATLVLPEGKHLVEVYDGLDRRMSKKMKLKGGRTTVFFVAGTWEIGDREPIRLIPSMLKSRRK